MAAKYSPKIYDYCIGPSNLEHMAAKCDPKICALSYQGRKKTCEFEMLSTDLIKQTSASNSVEIPATNVCTSDAQLQEDCYNDKDEYPNANKFEENKLWKISKVTRKAEEASGDKAPGVNKTQK